MISFYCKNIKLKLDKIGYLSAIYLIAIPFIVGVEALAQVEKNPQKIEQKNYYVRSKAYGSNPESEPPQYVKQLDKIGFKEFKNINWIEAGLSYRMRLEYRDNDYRRAIDRVDSPFLSRVLTYFGIKNILDPLRFAVELQDSRRYNGKFERDVRDVNNLDLFQGYGELYFENPQIFDYKLIDRPISIKAGRMAFEVMDRKLISRDDWGNTGTNFQGYRIVIGKKENDWQLDNFALNPIVKSAVKRDKVNEDEKIYAVILNWRRWSEIITLQPFFLKLTQDQTNEIGKRNINSLGLNLYGDFGDSGFDYSAIGLYQYGDSEGQLHRAYAYSSEIGYNFIKKYKPRLSLLYGFATGDKNPHDNKNQRFERFYGFNRPWSNNNHIEWENIEIIKTRLEIKPNKKFSLEGSYSFYWLASATDQWRRADLRDQTGQSGEYIGQDFDLRGCYEINKNLRTVFGYAHFMPKGFTRRVGRDNVSDFLYVEINASLF